MKDFDPHRATPAQLPVVATYLKQYGQAEAMSEGLAGLGEPRTARTEWDQLRGVVDREAVNVQDWIRAADAGDTTAFRAAVARADAIHEQLVRQGTALGFDGRTACGRFYS